MDLRTMSEKLQAGFVTVLMNQFKSLNITDTSLF